MQLGLACSCSAMLATAVTAHTQGPLPLVDSSSLRSMIKEQALMEKAQLFEDQALNTREGNRAIGTPGLIDSQAFVQIAVLDLDYYDVSVQYFNVSEANASFSVRGTTYKSNAYTFSPAGAVVAPLVPVANLGCDASDYPGEVAGNIALVSRGTCTFVQKGALAAAAGAAGLIIYNNVEGVLVADLSMNSAPEGPFVPTIGISQADGLALVDEIGDGSAVTGELTVTTIDILAWNIIAQTRAGNGDPNNVLHIGAHMDSVPEGPGLNDNASGTIGILEVAQALSHFAVTNAVRFSWWSAEEAGVVGSNAYVNSLEQAELEKIRLYLNFDMIGSKNYIIGIYDTVAEAEFMNISLPDGSREAETLWKQYFVGEAGLNWQYFNLRDVSDHAPFARAGVPFGGLFTGGSEIMSDEQARLFNGTAGLSSDPNNHGAGDNFSNINPEALLLTTKAIAHAVGTYARDFHTLPTRATKKEVMVSQQSAFLEL